MSFAYDALGRRNGKTINGTTTTFLYDGANAVQELASGTPSANMLTGPGIDEVFSRTDSLGTRSFVTDALGSTVALTDGSGAVKTTYAYEPYGNTTTSGEVNGNASQYTGRENDDSTGLFYYRGRYYHPGFSRFVEQDPIGLAGGNNLYAYVAGNPISKIDPLGLWGVMATVDASYYVGGGGSVGGGAYVSPDAGSAGVYDYTAHGGGFDAGFTASAGFFTGNGTCSLGGKSNFTNLAIGFFSVSIGYSDGHFSSLQLGIVGGTPNIFFAGASAGTSYSRLFPLISF